MSILRPQYQAAYGLWKVLFDRVEFTNYFRQVLQESRTSWLLLKSGGSHFPGDERYRTIRLLDTFFSDTIEPAVLDELVDGALQYGYSIKLLMLDPVGRAARSRAHALGVNAIRETNRGLAQLRSAMRRTEQRGKRGVVDLLERSRQDTLENRPTAVTRMPLGAVFILVRGPKAHPGRLESVTQGGGATRR